MNKKDEYRKKGNAYLKYSGLAFQMAGVLLLSLFIGHKLDEWAQTEQPYFTAGVVLFMFSAYMYKLYLELMPPNSK